MKDNEKIFVESISNKMRENVIQSIANGYKSCAQQILTMIDNGETIDDIEKYCSFIIDKNDVIVTAINKEEK